MSKQLFSESVALHDKHSASPIVLLDADVVCALLDRPMNECLRSWLWQQDITSVYISTSTLAETLERIPWPLPGSDAPWRTALDRILPDFEERILGLLTAADRALPAIDLIAHNLGDEITPSIRLVAAIALANKATVATRQVEAYRSVGVIATNPWTTPSAQDADVATIWSIADGTDP